MPADRPCPARRVVLRLGAAGAVAATAACARIPRSSSVDSTPVGDAQDVGAPYVQPRPPADGASPVEIVTGFVQAGVGIDDDFAVARSYLTADARRSWEPTAAVTVYSGGQEFDAASTGTGSVKLSVEAVAQVDAQGVRTVLAATSAREIDIALEQVDGQWRISRPPAGIFLSEQAFEILFTPGRLYFPEPRRRHLVPDVRWVTSQGQAAALLRQLGGGPAPWLAAAVASAVPAALGTERSTVSTDRLGAVQVTLPAAIAAMDRQERAVALAQITATLRSLPLLGEASLVSGGEQLVVDPALELARALPGHRPLGAGATGIVTLAEGGAAPAPLVPDLAATALRDPALSSAGVQAAALADDGHTLLIATTDSSAPVRTVAPGTVLAGPCIDDLGYVWTAPRDTSGAVEAFVGADVSRDVRLDAPWLVGREPVWLHLAPDATRLVVLSDGPDSARIDLCAVARDAQGTPTALTEPVTVPTGAADLTSLVQATWYDEVAVILLGADADGAPRAVVDDLATGAESLPAPPVGTTRLAGSATAGVIFSSTDEPSLARSDGSTWSFLSEPASCPSFY
ncbi:LpqB family beta-propeller domain-containing protein [Brachybacterium huguangmaarense]|uniref:LpqB family beta-propeller domain-containing protein n=1 Tax=Brachybacterium huguangmaarense TaxID=1652028 RepID=A0ABY6FXR9_9MICO|nr:LpqB family beta-propeller domain-containing protein [Brachybacterium huguangmaarense]UYG15713.1 LpqB family beta-propeller domain-containing protein [Brachybacterium huguangmaarense]